MFLILEDALGSDFYPLNALGGPQDKPDIQQSQSVVEMEILSL